MKRVILIGFVLSVFGFSVNSYAATQACQEIEVQCENAVALGSALVPFLVIGKNVVISAYNGAYQVAESNTPARFLEKTAPYLSTKNAKLLWTHTVLGLGASAAIAALQATIALPLKVARLPFRNRLTMFCAGMATMALYNAI